MSDEERTHGETMDEAAVRADAEWEARRSELLAALGLPPEYVLPSGNPNLAAARMTADLFAEALRRRVREWRRWL